MGLCVPDGRFQPGIRFAPTDEELAMYYLKKKVMRKRIYNELITEVDIYMFHPEDLPDMAVACLKKERQWFFFCPLHKKYGTGDRNNRANKAGYWKATGRDRVVSYKNRTVAKIKTLVFHTGKPHKENKTEWVMHEYRLEDRDLADRGIIQDSFVLCKIFHKPGSGPQNGAQYGARFIEEEWEDEGNDIGPAHCNASETVTETGNGNVNGNQNQSASALTFCDVFSPPAASELATVHSAVSTADNASTSKNVQIIPDNVYISLDDLLDDDAKIYAGLGDLKECNPYSGLFLSDLDNHAD